MLKSLRRFFLIFIRLDLLLPVFGTGFLKHEDGLKLHTLILLDGTKSDWCATLGKGISLDLEIGFTLIGGGWLNGSATALVEGKNLVIF